MFLIICLVVAGSVFAQNISKEDIVGVYNEKCNDPVGGSSVVFLPNQTVVILYFGGVQKGTWDLDDGRVIITASPQPQFVVYGRKTESLGTKRQVNFLIEPNNDVVVGLDSGNKRLLKPVFNQNANCFSFPYIFTQESKLIQLHAAQNRQEQNEYNFVGESSAEVYHFNIFDVYNDILLVNLPSAYSRKWRSEAPYKNGFLYMEDDDEGTQKRPLESLNEEDFNFINEFAAKSLFPNKLKHDDEFFPYRENPTKEDLNPYHRIEVLEIGWEEIEILEEPFFISICDED